MDAVLRRHAIPTGFLFRIAAAACGASLVAGWFALLVSEAVRVGAWIPHICSYSQALVLAGLFASYAIGWRHELMGATLALVGTVVFFAVGYVGTTVLPPLPAVWFAAPGVLYLLARISGDRRHGADLHSPKV